MPVTRNPITVSVVRRNEGLYVVSSVEVPEGADGKTWLKPMMRLDLDNPMPREAFYRAPREASLNERLVALYDHCVEQQRMMIERAWDKMDGVPGSEKYEVMS